MTTKTPKFTGVREVPLEGVNFALYESVVSMKQNLELLIGQRGESDNASRAITPAYITVPEAGPQRSAAMTAEGAGFSLQNAQVPSYDDYIKALTDMRNLAADVAELRQIVNALLVQLKG